MAHRHQIVVTSLSRASKAICMGFVALNSYERIRFLTHSNYVNVNKSLIGPCHATLSIAVWTG